MSSAKAGRRGCRSPRVDFARLRSASNAGTGQTARDIFGVSLSRMHHHELRGIRADAFSKNYEPTCRPWLPSSTARAPFWEMRASTIAEDQIGRPLQI